MRGAVLVAIVASACGRLDFAVHDESDAGAMGDAPAGDAPDTSGCPTVEPSSSTFDMTVTGASHASGSCGGGDAPELVLPFDVPAGGATVVLAGDQTSDDTVVYVADTCAAAGIDLACNLDNGINEGGQIVHPFPAGHYFAYVDGQLSTNQVHAGGQLVVELPAGSACPPAKPYWQCGPETSCMTGTCTPTCGTISSTLQGSLSYAFTDTTIGQPSLHAGSCGEVGDGGRRASERVYLLRLAAAASKVEVSTSSPGTDYDTLVYLRDGCLGTELACDDDGGALDNTSHFSVMGLAAGDYYVFVDGFSSRSGTFHLTIQITP